MDYDGHCRECRHFRRDPETLFGGTCARTGKPALSLARCGAGQPLDPGASAARASGIRQALPAGIRGVLTGRRTPGQLRSWLERNESAVTRAAGGHTAVRGVMLAVEAMLAARNREDAPQ